MTTFDLHAVMQHLAQRRPVLRPRRDFDQSLAVEIQRHLMRLEQLVQQGEFAYGYVILLTNDAQFWQPSVRRDTCDADFRLHEGRVLKGTLRWSEWTGFA